MGNVGHRHQHSSTSGSGGGGGGLEHQTMFVNQNVAWKQRKRKRLSAVLDKLHNNNSSTNTSSSPPTTMTDSQMRVIKTEDLQARNESRGTATTESSEDDKSEVYSASGSSPRITISPLRLAELDDNLNNNNNNNNHSNNNNYPDVMNKNALFNYPNALGSHFLSQISPGLHIKSEFPSPPYHRYLPMASPLYYHLQSRLPELLKRRNSNHSDSEHAIPLEQNEEDVPKSREEKRKRGTDNEKGSTTGGDLPLDLSMKALGSANASPQHCQKENFNHLESGATMPEFLENNDHFRNGADEHEHEDNRAKSRRNSFPNQLGGGGNNNNNFQQYNYQQQHYLTQQQLLATQHFQNSQLHLEFLKNQHQHQSDQQFLAKLSSPSPSSWSQPSLTPPSQGRAKLPGEKRTKSSGRGKANHNHMNILNNNSDMGSLNVSKGTATLLANMLPSGSMGVPIVKGDVASHTTKESVAHRYNLDVFPVVEEMPPGSDVAYVCPVCGQMFSLHDRLAKHMASRHKSKSASNNDITKAYGCDVCSRSFARSDMLTRHMRLHTGVKPYTCKVCGQVFSRSDHLSTHQRTHTGEKPYKCPQCPYAACRRDMITRHMRTHTRFDSQNPRGPSPADLAVAAAAAAAVGMHPFGSIKMEPMLSGMMGAMMETSPPVSPTNSMGMESPSPPPTPQQQHPMAIVKTESAV